nr:hypothetical protein [Tanacetum cinerariifolium]
MSCTSMSFTSMETPLFNLDFKAKDDAWHKSGVILDDTNRRLLVKLLDFPDPKFDELFNVNEFEKLDKLNEFIRRFKPASVTAECAKVTEGTIVCTCYKGDDGSLHYFDAIVDVFDLISVGHKNVQYAHFDYLSCKE